MMKFFLFFVAIAALFLTSCSDVDKFSASSNPKLELLDIVCGKSGAYAKVSLINDEKYYHSYWRIDGKIVSYDNLYVSYDNLYVQEGVSYGEHVFKFVLIDNFDDILSDSCSVPISEPLKITLLSPIDSLKAKKNTIEFQYKISGIDTWEENPQVEIYISTDKEVWTQIDSLWMPPTEETYYWRIKAFTEQDTAYSEIRSLCIKN